VIVELGGALLVALWVNALLRFEDYFHRGMLTKIIQPSYEAYFLWLELTLAFLIPITMLSFKRVRLSPKGLYLASLSTILGFVTNRLNVITVSIIAMGFFIFSVCVRYLPIFEPSATTAPARTPKVVRGEIPKPSHVTT
jgi:Ni/Fe-hydrogenase subunit HybB-like protein